MCAMVLGVVSIVHAFLVRNDYLVRLENRMHIALKRRQVHAAAWKRSTVRKPKNHLQAKAPTSQGQRTRLLRVLVQRDWRS